MGVWWEISSVVRREWRGRSGKWSAANMGFNSVASADWEVEGWVCVFMKLGFWACGCWGLGWCGGGG